MVGLALRLMHQATAVLRQRNSTLTLICHYNEVFNLMQSDVLNQPISCTGPAILNPTTQMSYGMLQQRATP